MTADEIEQWAKNEADEIFDVCSSHLAAEIKKQSIVDSLMKAYRLGEDDGSRVSR